MARIRAVLRRSGLARRARTRIDLAGFTLDRVRGTLQDRGRAVRLTPREFSLAWLFFSSPGERMARDAIGFAIWGAGQGHRQSHHRAARLQAAPEGAAERRAGRGDPHHLRARLSARTSANSRSRSPRRRFGGWDGASEGQAVRSREHVRRRDLIHIRRSFSASGRAMAPADETFAMPLLNVPLPRCAAPQPQESSMTPRLSVAAALAIAMCTGALAAPKTELHPWVSGAIVPQAAGHILHQPRRRRQDRNALRSQVRPVAFRSGADREGRAEHGPPPPAGEPRPAARLHEAVALQRPVHPLRQGPDADGAHVPAGRVHDAAPAGGPQAHPSLHLQQAAADHRHAQAGNGRSRRRWSSPA